MYVNVIILNSFNCHKNRKPEKKTSTKLRRMKKTLKS